MVGSCPNREESTGSQPQDHFINLEHKRDREASVYTTHTSGSHSQDRSYISHEENARNMQLEIDHLKRKLCHERWRRTHSNLDFSSDDEEDGSYRPRSRTPTSESFSYDEDSHHTRRSRSPSRKGMGNDAMSRALNQISKLPFMCRIEGAKFSRRFTQPKFTIYNGRTYSMEHVSHFNQRIDVHSKNEALMCKVFPSNLRLVAMRCFNVLGAGSIDSFKEFTWAFGSCFITCSRVLRPLDSLLSMTMWEGEILKTYSDRYWEMFNEIDGDFDNVAIRTFKVGLPVEHGLRKSLTGKPYYQCTPAHGLD